MIELQSRADVTATRVVSWAMSKSKGSGMDAVAHKSSCVKLLGADFGAQCRIVKNSESDAIKDARGAEVPRSSVLVGWLLCMHRSREVLSDVPAAFPER